MHKIKQIDSESNIRNAYQGIARAHHDYERKIITRDRRDFIVKTAKRVIARVSHNRGIQEL